jgi:serine/threonine protein phosphatase PrpC
VTGLRKALIIANDEYDQEALRNLHAPAADAEELSRVLADPQIGDFGVQIVRNEPAHVIAAQIEDFCYDSRSDDLLLMHFSGHGLKSESGELFFAASNTRTDRLGSTAVTADFLQRCMRDSRSRSVVLLLDCCYSGAFAKGVQVRAAADINVLDSFPQGRAGGGRGRAVITASSAMEFAFEGSQLASDGPRTPSVFTAALVEGLATGDADRDEDGWISLNELYDYIFDKVRQATPHQTPSRRIELEGELYLARSPRRRTRRAPIPADLQAALDDPNMYTRLGAMTELRSRLASDDLPTAVAAYEALQELTGTSSRFLAGPAAEALSEIVVRATVTELHFGEVEHGSAPAYQRIRFLGPAIARACAPSPSHDWIRVVHVDDGFDVTVDTANPGVLQGSLAFRGPAGEVTVAIDADVRGRPQPEEPETALAISTDHVEQDLGEVIGVSDRGLRHQRNEDAFAIATIPTGTGPDAGLVGIAVVADGVSSAPRPDVASLAAARTGMQVLIESVRAEDDPAEASVAAVQAAYQAVNALAGSEGAPATTYLSAVVDEGKITVCWLGDSRAYWLPMKSPAPEGPGGTIDISAGARRVTRDDSLAEEIVAAGLATMDEAMASPQAHVLTRWLGADMPDPRPHMEQFTPVEPGVLLLCTDGLWNYRPEASELAAMALPIALTRPLDVAADLVRFALDAGGLDNITVVLIPFTPTAGLTEKPIVGEYRGVESEEDRTALPRKRFWRPSAG